MWVILNTMEEKSPSMEDLRKSLIHIRACLEAARDACQTVWDACAIAEEEAKQAAQMEKGGPAA